MTKAKEKLEAKIKEDGIKQEEKDLSTIEISVKALKEIEKLNKDQGGEIDKSLPAIEVKGYTKKFRKFLAAKDVSFTVGHGKIHGFIGPNGSGKTTVIKAMIGAYIPTNGEIDINGHKAGTIKANQLIGYIPERASFPKHLNTVQYLTAMGEQSGLKAHVAKTRAKAILENLGLSAHAKRKPTGFSSGMQKKILLAQSLLTNPKILILDEPAANLDPTARKELFDQLIALRDQGKTILISSHILAELERLVNEVTFLYYGEVIYSGKVSKFTRGSSNVFIKSNDNLALSNYLEKKGYKVTGDLRTELEVERLSRPKIDELMKLITRWNKVSILSFRSNDLQSVYDKLISESEKENRGKQAVSGQKAIAMKKSNDQATKVKKAEIKKNKRTIKVLEKQKKKEEQKG